MADVAVVGGFGRLGAAQEVADLAVDVELVAAWGGFVGCGCVLVDGWVYGGRFDVCGGVWKVGLLFIWEG